MYKRLTERIRNHIVVENQTDALERLAELEDKIASGALIEFPRIDRYVDYCYGLEKFVIQWVVNGKVKNRTFWSKEKAEKKLKELKEV